MHKYQKPREFKAARASASVEDARNATNRAYVQAGLLKRRLSRTAK